MPPTDVLPEWFQLHPIQFPLHVLIQLPHGTPQGLLLPHQVTLGLSYLSVQPLEGGIHPLSTGLTI